MRRPGPTSALHQDAPHDAIRSGERVLVTGRAAHRAAIPTEGRGFAASARSSRYRSRSRLASSGRSGPPFPGPRTLEDAELELFDILADTVPAQAIERITAQEEAARDTAPKLAFLQGSPPSSPAAWTTRSPSANVARLAVRRLHLVRHRRRSGWLLAPRGRRTRGPGEGRARRRPGRALPRGPGGPDGAWHVMRTGRSELIREIMDEMLAAGAVDEEQLRIACDLHLRSVLTVPAVARSRVWVITWALAESERLYDEADLTLAEEARQARRGRHRQRRAAQPDSLAAAALLNTGVCPRS